MEVKVKDKIANIDPEDLDLFKFRTWQLSTHGYMTAIINHKHVMFHRLVMNAKPGQMIDHINHDILDNRKCNLRFVTKAQNTMNIKKYKKKCTSKYKGVSLIKNKNIWRAYIVKNDKQIFLGHYKTENEAAKAYNQGALKYFGEYAYLNKVD